MPKNPKYNVIKVEDSTFRMLSNLCTSNCFSVKDPIEKVRKVIDDAQINVVNCNGRNLLWEAINATNTGKAEGAHHCAIVALLKGYLTDEEIAQSDNPFPIQKQKEAEPAPAAKALPAKTIWQAAMDDDLEQLKAILESSPDDLNKKDESDFTPLQIAAINGSRNALIFLLEEGADQTDLKGAALVGGAKKIIDYLIVQGMFTAEEMMYQAIEDDLDQAIPPVLQHLDSGIDVHLDPSQLNALQLAASKGSEKSLGRLLASEPPPNLEATSRDNHWTAMQYAAANGHPRAAEMLHDKGANIDVVDPDDGNNIAHLAAAANMPGMMPLIAKKAPELFEKENANGDLPTHTAARAQNPIALEAIFEAQPSPEAKRALARMTNRQKETVADIVPEDHLRLANIVREYDIPKGADLRKQDGSNPEDEEAGAAAAAPDTTGPPLSTPPSTPKMMHKAPGKHDTGGNVPYTPSIGSNATLKQLLAAVADDNVDRVSEMLSDQANAKMLRTKFRICGDKRIGGANSKDGDAENEVSLLHLAACSGSTKVAEYLVDEQKMAPDALTSKQKYTPLHLAAQRNHTACAQYLADESGINRQTAVTRDTALNYAVDNGNLDMVNALAKTDLSGIPDEKNPINIAARNGNMEMFQALAAMPNAKVTDAAYLAAFENRHHDLAKHIADNYLNQGAAAMPSSPLVAAAMMIAEHNSDDAAIAKFMASYSDDLLKKATTPAGRNLLHLAVLMGNHAIIRYLHKYNPDLFTLLQHQPDIIKGNLPLHYTVLNGDDDAAIRNMLAKKSTTTIVKKKFFLGLISKDVKNTKEGDLFEAPNADGDTVYDLDKQRLAQQEAAASNHSHTNGYHHEANGANGHFGANGNGIHHHELDAVGNHDEYDSNS